MHVIDGNCLNVKIFSSIYKENLEEEINTFLKEKNEDNDYTYTKEIYVIQYTYNGSFSAMIIYTIIRTEKERRDYYVKGETLRRFENGNERKGCYYEEYHPND